MLRSSLAVLIGGLVSVSCSEIVAGLGNNTQCVGAHCSTFVAGAVCDGVDVSTPAVDMLRGKHLIIQDMEWMPYAAPNPGGRHFSGWKGLNIELFDHFATVLGYTYNMSNMGYAQEGESWTEQVYRAVDDADLTGSYWVEDDERLNKASFIRGTYDLTPVLVARMLGAGETKWETWYKSFYNFLDPFDKTLWFMILGFIIFSGVVDWLVERKSVKEARVSSSIYEYFAGLLWGGFEYPLSKMSAVYQVMGGFIVLVLISSYTANLAAFITVSAQPTKSVQSMDQAQSESASICAANGAYIPKIKKLYPRLRWGLVSNPQNEAAQATMDREGCDGVIGTLNLFNTWRTDVAFCKLEVAEVMAPARGSWLTNRESWCVTAAFNYAVAQMDFNGELELMIGKYFPKIPCGSTSSGTQMDDYWSEGLEDPEEDSRRRLLMEKDAATTASKHRRRLSADGGSGGGTGVPSMEVVDFLGMFILWLAVSLWMVFWTCALSTGYKSPLQTPIASALSACACNAPAPCLRPAVIPAVALRRCCTREGQGGGEESLDQDGVTREGRWHRGRGGRREQRFAGAARGSEADRRASRDSGGQERRRIPPA
jgi:hypothetical protein